VSSSASAPVFPPFEFAFSVDGLYRAYRRALRRHRRDPAAAAFTVECGPALCDLSRRLLDGTWKPLPVRTFPIRDPKPRIVCETPFPDRVVHHALVGALEPGVEALLDPESYACRKGKGLHRAVGRVQEFLRVHDYALSLDVRHYFPEVPHRTLVGLLAGMGVPDGYLRLVARILRGTPEPGGAPSRGMGIGALTSQFLGNVGLDPVERHLRAEFPDCDHVRYTDDLVVLGPSKRRLWELRRVVAGVVRGLGLEMKEKATRLVPAEEGVSFLGFRVYRGEVRPDRGSAVRMERRVRSACAELREGRSRDPDRVRAGIATRLNHALVGDADPNAGRHWHRLVRELW